MQYSIPTLPTFTLLSQGGWANSDSELWRDCTPRPTNAQEALLYMAAINALVKGLSRLAQPRETA